MTIVITGFGPFQGVAHNPSSDIVNLIDKEGIPGCTEKIVTEKLEVAYESVESKIKKLWKEHNPKLMLHIGVDSSLGYVKLEKQSFRGGYYSCDIHRCTPIKNICSTNCDSDILTTSVDCKQIASKVADTLGYSDGKIQQSFDPDRYLCAYSYYVSLSHSTDRSLFIHVPEFNAEFTLEKLTEIIREVVKEILKTY